MVRFDVAALSVPDNQVKEGESTLIILRRLMDSNFEPMIQHIISGTYNDLYAEPILFLLNTEVQVSSRTDPKIQKIGGSVPIIASSVRWWW